MGYLFHRKYLDNDDLLNNRITFFYFQVLFSFLNEFFLNCFCMAL